MTRRARAVVLSLGGVLILAAVSVPLGRAQGGGILRGAHLLEKSVLAVPKKLLAAPLKMLGIVAKPVHALPLSRDGVPTCVAPPQGMVGWWPGDGNPNDVSGDNNTGAFEGTQAYGTGEVNQAFNLNGTDADVKIPASPSLDVGAGSGFTLDLWFKPADLGERPLLEWNNGQPSGQPFGVHFYHSVTSQGGSAGNLYANIIDIGG